MSFSYQLPLKAKDNGEVDCCEVASAGENEIRQAASATRRAERREVQAERRDVHVTHQRRNSDSCGNRS
jgi:hypothetical protein